MKAVKVLACKFFKLKKFKHVELHNYNASGLQMCKVVDFKNWKL